MLHESTLKSTPSWVSPCRFIESQYPSSTNAPNSSIEIADQFQTPTINEKKQLNPVQAQPLLWSSHKKRKRTKTPKVAIEGTTCQGETTRLILHRLRIHFGAYSETYDGAEHNPSLADVKKADQMLERCLQVSQCS